jgi:hypothetical protein
MMNFEELDSNTRAIMFSEFNNEWSQSNHYIPDGLNSIGLEAYPDIMRKAIQSGTIDSLASDLSIPKYWNPTRTYFRKETPVVQQINPDSESKRLAHSEFTTIYTKGMAKKLMDEGEKDCQVYRADKAHQPKCECTRLEDTTVSVGKIYEGIRKKYFPKKDPNAFSIPSTPFCHHTIRRIK